MKVTIDRRLVQFIKFCLVGVLNTLVTLCTIFMCKSLLGVNEYVSNALGYILGVINSFLWNRQWVFRSHGGYSREAVKFGVGFLICYMLQLGTVVWLNSSVLADIMYETGFVTISGYGIATVLGCVVYTVCNFLYNRLITFRN